MYSCKLELPNKFGEILTRSLSAIPVKRFMGYMGKLIYDVYVNHALSCINIAENWYHSKIFSGIILSNFTIICRTIKMSILGHKDRNGQTERRTDVASTYGVLFTV